MPDITPIPLPFNCVICSKPLTDKSSLLTSCGHLFCLSPGATCSALGIVNGKCQICSNNCTSVALQNKATQSDKRVKSYIFDNPVNDLKTIIDILNFRERQREILSQNAYKYQKKVTELSNEMNKLHQTYRQQCELLTQQNNHLKIQLDIKNREIESLQSTNPINTNNNNKNIAKSTCTSMTTMLRTRNKDGMSKATSRERAMSFPVSRRVSKTNNRNSIDRDRDRDRDRGRDHSRGDNGTSNTMNAFGHYSTGGPRTVAIQSNDHRRFTQVQPQQPQVRNRSTNGSLDLGPMHSNRRRWKGRSRLGNYAEPQRLN